MDYLYACIDDPVGCWEWITSFSTLELLIAVLVVMVVIWGVLHLMCRVIRDLE